MISIEKLSIQFAGNYVFEDIKLKINKAEKIALVGPNGSGKTTFLRLLTGLEEPEEGLINKQKNLKIGYLPQEIVKFNNSILFHDVRNSIKEIRELESNELELTHLLSSSSIDESEKSKIIEKLGEVDHKKEELNYYQINSQIEKVLIGLGFSEQDFYRNTNEFSGGWLMRIELAKLLVSDNDIILLDEPTNHLDIDSLQWLIEFLQSFTGSIILVSHDNFFINSITNKTLEISGKKIVTFNGKYKDYIKYKKDRIEQLKDLKKNQIREIKETERFIERFRYKNTKAKQVQSRIKQLEKIEIIEIPELDSKIEIKFPSAARSSNVPIELKNISKTYGENCVFNNLNFKLERGDKVAFVGPNGAGKTTLAKLIANKIKPDNDSGVIKIGHNTSFAYYAQEVAEDLDPDKDILSLLQSTDWDLSQAQLRSLLGSFLFRGDDVFKKIKVLSGGEKSRVALAKILLTKSNLLVLDEPTNHLDIASKQILQNALINYSGSLILVSHDVDFLEPIVNKVFEIRKKENKLYYGGIDYYLLKRKEIKNKLEQVVIKEIKLSNRKDQKREEAELRQQKYKATRDIIAGIKSYEEKIEQLENLKNQLELDLTKNEIYSNSQLIKEKTAQYELTKKELETTYLKWSELNEKLERIEQSLK